MPAATPNPANAAHLDAALLDEKVRLVEQQLEALRASAASRHRWFLYSLIPHLVRIFAIIGLVGASVQLAIRLYALTLPSRASDSGASFAILEFGISLVSCTCVLLVATWALRYCQARSDGTLERTVSIQPTPGISGSSSGSRGSRIPL